MASRRAQRRKACSGKIRFQTEAEARKSISGLRRKGVTDWLVTYRCSFCHGFHFGHPPRRVRQAINAGR